MTVRLKPLRDQVIVITGASSGIGLVTARTAARQGARVMLVARDDGTLAAIAAEIRAAGGEADHRACDVADTDALQRVAVETIARFGRIDTWVNNAGIAIYGALVDTPDDEHRRLFDTNYFGVVHGCLAAIPALGVEGGALVTVASIASQVQSPVMGAYSASKHAVKGYVDALRIELASAGAPISVTLVKPSGIDTPIGHHAANHAGGKAQIPPPPYDPQLVADAILDSAVHPRREITVGGAGRLQTIVAQNLPRLFDRIAPIAAQTFTDPTGRQPGPPNLTRPAHDGDERSGDLVARRTSLYTAAAKRPGMAAALGLAAIAGGLSIALGLSAARKDR